MKGITMKKALIATVALLPGVALAHTGHEVSGFISGLAHPVGGADHLLAMLAVGLWAARLGGRALWLVPLAFVATMLLGNLLALSGVSLVFTEQGIGLSVVVLGLLLAFAARFVTPVVSAMPPASRWPHWRCIWLVCWWARSELKRVQRSSAV
jgi:urease accessory protein